MSTLPPNSLSLAGNPAPSSSVNSGGSYCLQTHLTRSGEAMLKSRIGRCPEGAEIISPDIDSRIHSNYTIHLVANPNKQSPDDRSQQKRDYIKTRLHPIDSCLRRHLSHHRTMPYATHWVCCKCGFGPMLIDNYPSCLNCQHHGARAGCCTHAALAMEATRVEQFSPYSTSESSMLSSSFEPVEDAPVASLYPSVAEIMDSRPMVRNHATSLYICCSCGDGPKVYQHHARCVMCNHDACAYCTHVK